MGYNALTKIDVSFSTFVPSSPTDSYLAKRRTANHPCPVCGKHYVNEGSLRKHLACHPETSQLTTSLRMWPCSVCQAVFTHESGNTIRSDSTTLCGPVYYLIMTHAHASQLLEPNTTFELDGIDFHDCVSFFSPSHRVSIIQVYLRTWNTCEWILNINLLLNMCCRVQQPNGENEIHS